MKIAINPGHCPGLDPGAVNRSTGLKEAEVNVAVAMKLQDRLLANGYDARLIQSNDLQDICNNSNDYCADLFISIHCNAAESEEAHGSETFYCAGSANGEHLARLIQSELVALGMTDRGIKDNPLYVTRHTDAVAVLVELAFISNATEEFMLGNDSWQDKFAYAIYRGIEAYVEAMG